MARGNRIIWGYVFDTTTHNKNNLERKHEKKQKKRAEAEARNASHAKTKDLRKAQQSAERKWEKAEAEVAELQAKLADPAVYEDNDKVKEIVAAHEAAKDTAADLMAQWEAATLALEAARS